MSKLKQKSTKHYNKRSRPKRIFLADRAEAIRQVLSPELRSIEDVADLVGLSISGVESYARDARIDLPTQVYRDDTKVHHQRRYNRKERLESISQALAEGVNSLEELCKRTHLKPSGLRKFCGERNVTLPENLIPYKYWPEADVLIERGISINQIGDMVSHTRESVRLYINDSGQYNLWRVAREKVKDAEQRVKNAQHDERPKREDEYRQLVAVLEARLSQIAQNEGWAVQMAIKHKMSIRPRSTNTPYKKIVKIFERYTRAQRIGKKLSLEELGTGLVPYPGDVGKILKRVGIGPMYGARDNVSHIRYPVEQKRVIERLVQTGMPNKDVAYFVGVHPNFPHQYFERKRIDKNTAEIFIPQSNTVLTYRLASQIYEAQDLGFNRTEIKQLLDTREKCIDFAIENRWSISRTIVRALRIVYHDRRYNVPYKSPGKN